MKALLTALNAKYIHTNLALYSLSQYASEYKDEVELLEYTINNRMDMLIQKIYEKKPDVLFFSCYIWNIEYVKDAAREIHKLLPQTDIWLGGPEVSYEESVFLKKESYLKGVMLGEGEITFKELMRYYCCKDIELSDVGGIMYRDNDSIIKTKTQQLIDMDELPFVYGDLSLFENKIIYYESSRGCPFKCSYCMSSIDRTVRYRSLGLVKKELKFFLDNRVMQVKFLDRTFNVNEKRTVEIFKFINENDNNITNFHFEIEADLLTDDEIRILNSMRPGLVQLEIGVQSTNKVTLKEIDRHMDFDYVASVCGKIRSASNVHVHLDLIAGLPYEDIESFRKSFNDVYYVRPHELQLGFLKMLKGSKMHRFAGKYGIIYNDRAPYEVFSTNWLSYDDIIRLKGVEDMLEVYYNSGLFPNSIRYLENFFETPFDLYDGLAAYYQALGLQEISHTRISRYNILYEYAMKILKDAASTAKSGYEVYAGEFAQLLVFDLYLRENLKTRPDFACDIKYCKEKTSDIYKVFSDKDKHCNIHVEPFEVDVMDYADKNKATKNTGTDKEKGEFTRPVHRKCIVVFDYDKKHPVSKMADAKEYK